MRILRAANYRQVPWKNGGGITSEVLAYPWDASIDNFDWRISMATISEDGQFSRFPGVDRTLCVLTGAGISLSVKGRPVIELQNGSKPCGFAADAVTHSRLIDGAVTDLNVMTRRTKFDHKVSVVSLDRELILQSGSGYCVAIAGSQSRIQRGGVELGPQDGVVLEPYEASARLLADRRSLIYVIEVRPV